MPVHLAPPPCLFDPGHATRAFAMSSADEKMSGGVPAKLVFPGEHPDMVELQEWLQSANAEIAGMNWEPLVVVDCMNTTGNSLVKARELRTRTRKMLS